MQPVTPKTHDSAACQAGWKDTMPMARTSWRISNFDRILLSWRVYELEPWWSLSFSFKGGLELTSKAPVQSNHFDLQLQPRKCTQTQNVLAHALQVNL